MSSQDTFEPHHTDALRLLAEFHGLLDGPPPDPCPQIITDSWETLRTTYHTWAEFLESCKQAMGGSWDNDKPDRADRCEEKRARCANSLIAATRDYSAHSGHAASIGRRILALSGEHQRWERTFLLWRFEVARADLDRMDRQCGKLKRTADKWEARARREHKKVMDLYVEVESEIGRFVEFMQGMEEAEEKVKGFWARERWGKTESGLGREACAEEMRRLEAWRVWPVGRLCEGLSVWDCVVDHEHE